MWELDAHSLVVFIQTFFVTRSCPKNRKRFCGWEWKHSKIKSQFIDIRNVLTTNQFVGCYFEMYVYLHGFVYFLDSQSFDDMHFQSLSLSMDTKRWKLFGLLPDEIQDCGWAKLVTSWPTIQKYMLSFLMFITSVVHFGTLFREDGIESAAQW